MSVITIPLISATLLAVNLWLARRGGNAFTG